MAEVFLARRPGPDGFEKRVALKRILPHLAKQADFVAMFLDEAKLAAGLDHSHIVHIHDFGKDNDAYYLAMEYVCGEDLAAIVRRANELKGRLPLADVATILVAACEALHHAHEQGVVHRDVTPANLLVSYDGVVKLADFGIAKSQQVASRAQTTVGTLKGKVPYMSPEQARARPLDRRSDLFSLGVVAWELLTGKRLFHRRNELDTLRAVQMCDVPSLSATRPDVPPALAAAIETALEPKAEDRWTTAAEMAQALLSWLSSAGETPNKARLAGTMAALFGNDAAERRLASVTTPSDATAANLMLPPPDVPSQPPPRVSPLRPDQWIPQIAMHLHLPPPRMPPLRLLGPILALLLSAGGLLFGFRSPHASRALTAGALPTITMPAATAPSAMPQLKLVPRPLHLDHPPPALPLPTPPALPLPTPRVQERTVKPRPHDRQRRTRRVGV
ncbi:MAG: serine/threonine protein kinase [bacterium]|nr:serine/threonine protein kinase [bacterium]